MAHDHIMKARLEGVEASAGRLEKVIDGPDSKAGP